MHLRGTELLGSNFNIDKSECLKHINKPCLENTAFIERQSSFWKHLVKTAFLQV